MADLKFTKSTDTEHEIKLSSELISAGWSATVANAGSRVAIEVRTFCVGNGAKIKVSVKTDGGKTIAKIKDTVLSNVFTERVDIPDDLTLDDAVYFEFELSDNDISGKSKSIPVIPTPIIKNISWSEKEARRGESLTLTAELEGARDNSPASLIIYEYDPDGHREKISEIKSEVKRGKVEAVWEYEYHEDTSVMKTDEEMKEYGRSYNPPEYFFTVKLGTLELGKAQESGLLKFKDYVKIALEDDSGQHQLNQKYILHMPDGSTRDGQLDDSGKAIEKDIPPGRVSVEFPDLKYAQSEEESKGANVENQVKQGSGGIIKVKMPASN